MNRKEKQCNRVGLLRKISIGENSPFEELQRITKGIRRKRVKISKLKFKESLENKKQIVNKKRQISVICINFNLSRERLRLNS